jgi:hypothetical protein
MVMRDMMLDFPERGELQIVYSLWKFDGCNMQKKS